MLLAALIDLLNTMEAEGDMVDQLNEVKIARTDYTLVIGRPRAVIWKALTTQLSDWWPNSFCINPKRVKTFRADMTPGSRVFEDWGDGQGLLWWHVNRIDAISFELVLEGTLGGTGVDFVNIRLEETKDGTRLKVSDTVWSTSEPTAVMEEHAGGWKLLLEDAFKPYVERM
jgi:hypothetical protein